MPTARVLPEGEIVVSSSRTYPYVRNAVTLQPLPWVEGVLRYTTILNHKYGAKEFSGDQSYKDRGFDIKIKLIDESQWLPQVAVGLRDVGGTGLFSGEYVVLSRRYFDFDFALGVGWGYTGARGNIPNPLASLFSRFKTRQNVVGQGGTLSAQYFKGERAAIFGGVTWHTPVSGLVAKFELDGNDYQNEPRPNGPSNNQSVKSPFNFGLLYRYSDTVDLGLAYERGNTVMAQLVLKGNFENLKEFPKFDRPAPQLKPRPVEGTDSLVPVAPSDKRSTITLPSLKLISREVPTSPGSEKEGGGSRGVSKGMQAVLTSPLAEQGIKLRGSVVSEKKALLEIEQNRFGSAAKGLGRAVRAVANELPAGVEEITVRNLESGLETFNVSLMRKDLERALTGQGSVEEIGTTARIRGPRQLSDFPEVVDGKTYPDATLRWSPGMRHHVGGPDNPWFYQISLNAGMDVELSRHWSFTSNVNLNLYNNFQQLKLESDSLLPHVRSDIKHYLKQGQNNISRFQLDYLRNVGDNGYMRLSGGLFEEMFGGVGGEYLYRPYGRRWALGVDINRVRQRDYTGRFEFRDYRVTTGHVDWYYELPFYNTRLQVSAGQYLAGDRGVTFDISRRFNSGAVIGGFVTLTNVSAQQFGEGSFDKGIYVSVPLDVLSLFSSRTTMGIAWRPLTRDGGQRLEVGKRLYPLLRDASPDALMKDWNRLLE